MPATSFFVFSCLNCGEAVGSPDEPVSEEADPQSTPGAESELVAVGEYDAGEGEEEVAFAKAGSLPQNLKPPDALQEAINARVGILQKLQELDREREGILADEELPENVKNELLRQRRELDRLPGGEQASSSIDRLAKQLAMVSRKVKKGEAEPLDPRMAEAHRLAFRQWQFCQERERLSQQALEAALELAREEPLYQLLRKHDIECDALFGWSIYATALEGASSKQTAKKKTLQLNLTGLDQKNKGLLNRLRRNTSTEEEERGRLQEAVRQSEQLVSCLSRERNSLERLLTKSFWEVYTEATAVLLRDDLNEDERVRLRAFYRYTAISTEPWFLEPKVAEHILSDCRNAETECSYSMSAMRVYYADEYILLVAKGLITPSVDEDLELNQRHTPPWHADRTLRRRIGTFFRITALKEIVQRLQKRIDVIRNAQKKKEESRDKLTRSMPEYKQKMTEYGQQIQKCKVEAARFERAIERVQEEMLPQQHEIKAEADEKWSSLEYRWSSVDLAKKEATALHRICRLCAKLMDPFPPFALRDNYKPQTDAENPRGEMVEELQEVERRDPTIFKEALLPVKKVSQRIYLRYCPVLVLAPACGFMSYAWNPRAGAEVGRLVMPAYMPRPGLRQRLLHNVLSDFRWDTSKASAGVDLLTSDTLVAAYATVRWDYRKKQKPTREKAGIYTEENDRTNWRRHYTLYLQSAMDGGKKLFFKCPEVYEAVLRYVILPEGVEQLKK
jgi:hypothetical protein